jgi:hypothetical protein
VTTGSNNIGLGYDAGDNITTGSNNIVIGYDINAPLATGSNQLNIGNLLYGTGLDGTQGTISSGNIGIGTNSPTARLAIAAPAEQISGSELITNGTFTGSATGWTLGDCAVYGSNQVTLTYTACSDHTIEQSITTQSGKRYKLTFSLSGVSGDRVALYTDDAGVYGDSFGNGSQSYYFTSTITGANTIYFDLYDWNPGAAFTIDNVSVKEVTSSTPSLVVTGYDGSTWLSLGDLSSNLGLGKSTLASITNGDNNVAVGSTALALATTGDDNTATGAYALSKLTTGFANTANGALALASVAGSSNTATGAYALASATTTSFNTANGAFALHLNTTGASNTAIGASALYFNTTGGLNTALGRFSLRSNTTGNNNTALGYQAGYNNSTGSSNIFIGYTAGFNETGSNKLYIENSSSASPLIFGDFSTDALTINGSLSAAYTGTSAIGSFDASNSSANGLAIDVQSSSSSQYALNVTSNNGSTNGLYVRADGRVGIGTTSPSAKLNVAAGTLVSGNALTVSATYTQSAGNDDCAFCLSLAQNSTNASGAVYARALRIDSSFNTSGAGSKDLYGLFLNDPTITACTSGACVYNGIYMELGTGTNVTERGLNFIAFGGASGTIQGLNMDMNSPGAANEYAMTFNTNWDAVIRVGSNDILNGSGVLQSAGLSGTYSNALTFSSSSNAYTGASLNLSASLASPMATIDNSNTSGDGLDIDIQNNGTSRHALNVTSNNGAFNLIYARADGNVGIGTTAPAFKLHVASTRTGNYVAQIENTGTGTTDKGLLISLDVANASRTANNYFIGFASGTTVAGKIQGGASAVVYTTTLADFAEYFLAANPADKPQVGEVVSIGSGRQTVDRSATDNDPKVVGVISDTAGFVGNGPICNINDSQCDTDYELTNVKVALMGQVPTKVTNLGGAIKPGDYLTSSSIPGVARKAADGEQVFGRALDSYDQASTGTIMVLVSATNPMAGIGSPSATLSASVPSQTFDQLTVQGGLTVVGPSEFKGPAIFRAIAEFFNNVIFHNDVLFEGRPTFNADTAGFAMIKSGQQEVTVTFDQEYADQPVIQATASTPQLDDQSFAQQVAEGACAEDEGLEACQDKLDDAYLQDSLKYIITKQSAKGFTIKLQAPASKDLTFSWVAVAVKDAKTFSQSQAPTN